MGHLRYILDTARPIPLSKRSLTKRPVILGFHQMTAKPKQVVYDAMTGEKSLSLSMRLKPSHLSLLLSCRLVGQFTSVVFVLRG